jgi:16S rRNA (guanine527-N7)-methyltransferase
MEIVEAELHAAGLKLNPTQLQQLMTYTQELAHWNQAVNLSALHGAELWKRLIIEPIRIGEYLGMSGVLADVGSGNGSPGIPLSLVCDLQSVHLIEPRLKRATFLRHVVGKLGLRHVVVHRSRIEELAAGALRCDWISLQAIDPTPDIIHALKRIATSTTRVVWITSKSRQPSEEATTIELPGMNMCGWTFPLDQT